VTEKLLSSHAGATVIGQMHNPIPNFRLDQIRRREILSPSRIFMLFEYVARLPLHFKRGSILRSYAGRVAQTALPQRRAASGPSRSATDIDGHRAFSEAANRPDMPLISFEFYSKPTHKVTHFHMLEEIK